MFEVKEKPKIVERALLVGITSPQTTETATQAHLAELAELTRTLGIEPVERLSVRCREPHPRLLLGKGKAEKVVEEARRRKCDVIIFDDELSPAQQRNWETLSKLCVIDRQEVILDIFNDRAQTREAVLQVELARLEYSLPRLKRAWTHLNRQRGGGVTQRGEGESQLELDQRMVRQRISRLRRLLDQVVRHREVQRKRRMSVPVPSGAIVGYTNAGKSSLLNALTGSDILAEDKLFATLDPTSRRLRLPSRKELVLTDTVGFVRKLPHSLVEAFKATLEEALVADFLLIVLDVSSPDVEEHYATTTGVLEELGAGEKPRLIVFNKADLMDDPWQLRALAAQHEDALFVSTRTRAGLDLLQEKLDLILRNAEPPLEALVPHDRYDMVAELHRAGIIQFEDFRSQGVFIRAEPHPRFAAKLRPFVIGSNGASETALNPGAMPDLPAAVSI